MTTLSPLATSYNLHSHIYPDSPNFLLSFPPSPGPPPAALIRHSAQIGDIYHGTNDPRCIQIRIWSVFLQGPEPVRSVSPKNEDISNIHFSVSVEAREPDTDYLVTTPPPCGSYHGTRRGKIIANLG